MVKIKVKLKKGNKVLKRIVEIEYFRLWNIEQEIKYYLSYYTLIKKYIDKDYEIVDYKVLNLCCIY